MESKDLDANLMKWLSDQVTQLNRNRENRSAELERLKARRSAILDESGLRDIQGQVKKALNGFDTLTRVQQRTLLEKIISQIVIRSDKEVEIRLFDSSDAGAVTLIPGRTPKLDSGVNGGVDGT